MSKKNKPVPKSPQRNNQVSKTPQPQPPKSGAGGEEWTGATEVPSETPSPNSSTNSDQKSGPKPGPKAGYDSWGSKVDSLNGRINRMFSLDQPITMKDIMDLLEQEDGVRPKQSKYNHVNGLLDRGILQHGPDGKGYVVAGPEQMLKENAPAEVTEAVS